MAEILPSFRFQRAVTQIEMTGLRASNLVEFNTIVRSVPDACIFHHVHQAFLRQHTVHPVFTNDFSAWVAARGSEQLPLAEKLANIAPFDIASLGELRRLIAEEVANFIATHPAGGAAPGPIFYFDLATTLVIPGNAVASMAALRVELGRCDASSIYYHFFEARMRRHRPVDDFSQWIEHVYEAPKLVAAIRGIDPYMHSLEELRILLIHILDRFGGEAVRRRAA